MGTSGVSYIRSGPYKGQLEMTATIKVIHAANDGVFVVPDRTPVRVIRASLADAFNVPPTALALNNGERVGYAHGLHDNDTLEFVVRWGRKGSDLPRLPLTSHDSIDITGGVPTFKRIGVEYGKAVVASRSESP